MGIDFDRERTDSGSLPADRFRTFVAEAEPPLRRALVAAYGTDPGADATAEALAYAWEHFARLEGMANPVGYLWRVGQSAVRREFRRRAWTATGRDYAVDSGPAAFEPGLVRAMAALTVRQRTAVLLVHGHGMSLRESADAMGCRIRTLRNHLDRGMRALRQQLGVINDG